LVNIQECRRQATPPFASTFRKNKKEGKGRAVARKKKVLVGVRVVELAKHNQSNTVAK